MKRSYLVQRLLKLPTSTSSKKDLSALAFGGGLKNGGLSDEAMNLFSKIFAFDYMGSAEFEWGAVPEALGGIWGLRDEYIASKVKISYYYRGWRFGKDASPDRWGEVEVYIICQKDDLKEVTLRIRAWADERHVQQSASLKERTMFPLACSGCDTGIRPVKGWLELDNGFFWFIDDEMFQKTSELFGVRVES